MASADSPIKATAPAKINLSLEIIGKRADGYHDLRSLVVPISLADEILFEHASAAIATEVDARGLPRGNGEALVESDQNLATRAAQLLKKESGYPGGVRIRIRKRIPIGGGLGGGSADAACTLTALNALWNLGFSRERLMALGEQLGADVPVMIYGKAACMEGVGERITPLAGAERRLRADWWIVVVNPGFAVPTKDIYNRYNSTLTCAPEVFNTLRFALLEGDVALAAAHLYNALQPTVFGKYPLLAIVAEALRKAGALGVLLAGSGASLFALARSEIQAQEMERRIREAMGSWLWSRVARILPDGVIGSTRPFGG